jgi:hypothetical protein
MTIEEVKTAKLALELIIKEAICDFQQSTGLIVERVDCDQHHALGALPAPVITVEARL